MEIKMKKEIKIEINNDKIIENTLNSYFEYNLRKKISQYIKLEYNMNTIIDEYYKKTTYGTFVYYKNNVEKELLSVIGLRKGILPSKEEDIKFLLSKMFIKKIKYNVKRTKYKTIASIIIKVD